MTARTWRQGHALMASVDAALDVDTLTAAIAAARRRWPEIPDAPAALLVGDDFADALQLARARSDLVDDVRQVHGLPNDWAIAWFGPTPD